MGLSACYCVKNEEKFIGYSIASIIDVVDEVIVVDEGSTDNTLNIVRSFNTDKIKIFELDMTRYTPLEGFNLRFELASSEWIFQIDGDEVFTDRNVQKIPFWLNRAREDKNIWALITSHRHFVDPYNVYNREPGIRPKIFRRGMAEYRGKWRTETLFFGDKWWRHVDKNHFLYTDINWNHYTRLKNTYLERVEVWIGYLKAFGLSEEEAREKVERVDEVRTDIATIPYEGEQPEVFKKFKFEGGFDLRPWELYYEGKKAIEKGEREKAKEYFNEAIVRDSDFTPAWFYAGKIALEDGDPQGFVEEIEREIEALSKRNPKNTKEVKELVALISVLKGIRCFSLGDYPRAVGYVTEGLKLTKEYQYRLVFNGMVDREG